MSRRCAREGIEWPRVADGTMSEGTDIDTIHQRRLSAVMLRHGDIVAINAALAHGDALFRFPLGVRGAHQRVMRHCAERVRLP